MLRAGGQYLEVGGRVSTVLCTHGDLGKGSTILEGGGIPGVGSVCQNRGFKVLVVLRIPQSA